MKVLVVGLTYGDRPKDIIEDNLVRAGYPFKYVEVNKEGVANALNDGIDLAVIDGFDAVAYLANDIIEPNDWLKKKVEALEIYPFAGIVASSLDEEHKGINSGHIISNWLLSLKVVDKIGCFNEHMFPYGPIDLDYCERANMSGFNTYYVKDCLAQHIGEHGSGEEYGYDKAKLLLDKWDSHVADIQGYRNGTKKLKLWRLENM